MEHLFGRRIRDGIGADYQKMPSKRHRSMNRQKSTVSASIGAVDKVSTKIIPGIDETMGIPERELSNVSQITKVSDPTDFFEDISREILRRIEKNRNMSSVFEETGMVLMEGINGKDLKKSSEGKSSCIYQISSVSIEPGCFEEILTEIIDVIEDNKKSSNRRKSNERQVYIICSFEEETHDIFLRGFSTRLSQNNGDERKNQRKSMVRRKGTNVRSQKDQETHLVISIRSYNAHALDNKKDQDGFLMEVYRSNNEINAYSRKYANDDDVEEVSPLIEMCRSSNEEEEDACKPNGDIEKFGRSRNSMKDFRKRCKRKRFQTSQFDAVLVKPDSLILLVESLKEIIHGFSLRDPYPTCNTPKRQTQICSLMEVHSCSKERQCSGKNDENVESNETLDTSYLPGMDDSAALRCLAFLPVTEHWRLSMVSRRHKDLVQSSLLLKLRQEYKIVQQWICIYTCGNNGWAAFDPKQNTWRNLRHADVDPNFDLSDKESLSAGSHLLWLGREAFNFACYRYDLISNSWDRGPPMVNARCLFASASCGQYAFVAGGFTVNGMLFNVLNTSERYDSIKGIWEPLASMNTPRHKCSGFFMDGKFYVIGGKSMTHEPLTSGEEYDPVKNVWRTIEDMYPIPPCTPSFEPSPPLVAVAGNELYGIDSSSNLLKVYEKQSNTWKVLGSVPVRADFCNGWGLAFKAFGDEIFVIGGHRVSNEEREGVAVFSWRPHPSASAPEWKLINSRVTGTGML